MGFTTVTLNVKAISYNMFISTNEEQMLISLFNKVVMPRDVLPVSFNEILHFFLERFFSFALEAASATLAYLRTTRIQTLRCPSHHILLSDFFYADGFGEGETRRARQLRSETRCEWRKKIELFPVVEPLHSVPA